MVERREPPPCESGQVSGACAAPWQPRSWPRCRSRRRGPLRCMAEGGRGGGNPPSRGPWGKTDGSRTMLWCQGEMIEPHGTNWMRRSKIIRNKKQIIDVFVIYVIHMNNYMNQLFTHRAGKYSLFTFLLMCRSYLQLTAFLFNFKKQQSITV